jgi:hypothetical protein
VIATSLGCGLLVQSDLPILRARAWARYDNRADPDVRFLDATRRELLLRTPEDVDAHLIGPYVGPTYKLVVETQELSVASDDLWEEATGDVISCFQSPNNRHAHLSRDLDHQLWSDGRILATAGRFTIRKRSPHESDYVAVLSADGPRGGLTVWWGRSTFHGQHYHQTFSVKQQQFVGPPVKLPFRTVEHEWSPCVVENRLVLYVEVWGDGLVAVPLENLEHTGNER